MPAKIVSTPEVRAALIAREEIALFDVREEGPFARGHPLFAASLPLGRIEVEILDRVPRQTTPVVVYDAGDGLAARAAARLGDLGYVGVSVLEGGLRGWRDAGGEVFRDVNVPSKAFGELVHACRHTPSISARELKWLLDEHADVVVLDARRFDEYHVTSIPTAVNVPGAELVYRVGELAPGAETLVVVNCAGRTRSIIGAQSLVNAGIPNPVVALCNGTIGWTLAELSLESSQSRRALPVRAQSLKRAQAAARLVATRAGVARIDRERLAEWVVDPRRTTYRFDVRPPEEYAAGHVRGFRSAPGGQLVQETDLFAPVRGARVVLSDNDGVRADMTASWLAQMGWDVYVLDEKREGGDVERGPWRPTVPPLPSIGRVSPSELSTWVAADGAVVLDVASSVDYARAHVPGAWLTSRTDLDRAIVAVPRSARYVVTSPDGVLAAFAAPDVAALTGEETLALAGGTRAWREDARPCERGLPRTPGPVDDVYKRPYEGTGHAASAMQAYLDWEAGLVAQLERDGTHGFRVL